METREQFIVDLARRLHLQPDAGAAQVYSDVPPSDPDYGYVMAAVQAGWISGFPGGTFQPNGSLTREQMAKVEILALGLGAQATILGSQRPGYSDAGAIGRWAWGYVNEATAIGILQGFAGGTFGAASTFTADQEAHAISQLAAYVQAHAKPVVTGVAPASGPAAGGTAVTITGSGFTGATSVHFGAVAATSFTTASDTSITATAPAGTGTLDVTVTTPNGTSAESSADHFSYAAPPVGPGPVAAAALHTPPTAAASTDAAGDTTIAATPNNGSDTLAVEVSSTAIATPLAGSAAPSGAAVTDPYTSGADLAAAAGDSVGVYELDGSGNVVAFSEIQLTAGEIAVAAPALNTPPTAAASTDAANDTVITATPNTAGDTLAVEVSSTAIVTPPGGSAAPNGAAVTDPYTSGTDLAAATGDSVGVYELDGSGKVVAFSAIQLTAGEVAPAPAAFQTLPSATASADAAGDTTITATPNTAGDTLAVKVSSTAIVTPPAGSAAPTGAAVTNPYASGSDLAVAAGDYVAVYELVSGKIVAFSEIEVVSFGIAAAALTTPPTPAASTDAVGDTRITATPNTAGDTLAVEVSSTSIAIPPGGIAAPTGAAVIDPYTSNSDLAAAAGDFVGVYELDGSGKVVAFSEVQLTSGEISAAAVAFTALPMAAASADVPGDTRIAATPNTAGDTLAVKVSSTAIATPVAGSAAPTGAAVTNPYTSGSDLAAAAGDSVGVYELDGSGKVVAFSEIQLTAGEIALAAAAFTAPPTAAASQHVSGDTTITATPNTVGDTLAVQVSSASIATPLAGSAAPTGAAVTDPYSSGADLAATAGDYVGVYELDSGGKVVAFSEIQLTSGEMAAAAFNTPPTAAKGTSTGTTAITVTPNNPGDTLAVEVAVNSMAIPPTGTAPPVGVTSYTSGTDLHALAGYYVVIFELDANDTVVAFSQILLTGGDIAAVAPTFASVAPSRASAFAVNVSPSPRSPNRS